MDEETLYQRQEELDLDSPSHVTVVGIGGIGSWVALNLAMSNIEKITLIDYDHIEEHNLNRTPFKQNQVDQNKAEATATLITERRDIEIEPITTRLEDVPDIVKQEINESTIIDCRDSVDPLEIDTDIILSYDGLSITIDTEADYENYWGDGEDGYDVTPSCLMPPQFLANYVTTYLLTNIETEQIQTYQLDELAEKIIKGEI